VITVSSTTRSELATRLFLVVFAALLGALGAHALQVLILGQVSVAATGAVATVAAVLAWMRLRRRTGLRPED
jgi:hypothetical protein